MNIENRLKLGGVLLVKPGPKSEIKLRGINVEVKTADAKKAVKNCKCKLVKSLCTCYTNAYVSCEKYNLPI